MCVDITCHCGAHIVVYCCPSFIYYMYVWIYEGFASAKGFICFTPRRSDLFASVQTRDLCVMTTFGQHLFSLDSDSRCRSPAGGIEDYCSLFPGNEKSIIWNRDSVLLFERQNIAHIFLLIRSHTALGKVIKRRFFKPSNGPNPIYTPHVVQMPCCYRPGVPSPACMYECLVAHFVNSCQQEHLCLPGCSPQITGTKGILKEVYERRAPCCATGQGICSKKNTPSLSIITQHLTLSNLNDENVKGVTDSGKLRS